MSGTYNLARILLKSGSLPIDQIQAGDLILNNHGLFSPVTEVFKEYFRGPAFKIKTHGFNEEFIVSGSQKVLSCKAFRCLSGIAFCTPDCKRQYCNNRKTPTKNCKQGYKGYKLGFNETKDLVGGDILVFPRPKFERSINVKLKLEKRMRHPTPPSIIVSPDIMRLFGYYLAEGCSSRVGIILVFNKNETEYHEDVKNLVLNNFNVEGHSYETKRNAMRVCFHSRVLSNLFFETLGNGSRSKAIPTWAFDVGEDHIRELFKGWALGDGGFNHDSFRVTTTNQNFIHVMRLLLIKMGVVPIYSQYRAKGGMAGRLTMSSAQLKKLKEITGIEHPNPAMGVKRSKYFYVDENYVYYPIRSIEEIEYEGNMWGLKTDDGFVANFVSYE